MINAGSNYEISIGDLTKKIINLMGIDVKVICDEQRIRPEKSEVNRLWADNTKIKKLTGWEPKYPLYDGLMETISWMKENYRYYKNDIYNI